MMRIKDQLTSQLRVYRHSILQLAGALTGRAQAKACERGPEARYLNLMLHAGYTPSWRSLTLLPSHRLRVHFTCTHHTAAASHWSPLRVHPSLGAASLVISPLVGFGCTPAWRGFTTLMRLQFASGKSTWPGFTTLLANAAVFFDRDTPA